jgi:hypothetical protein
VSDILYEYYQNRVTQPLIREHLQEWGIDISVGHINQLLTEGHERFEAEQDTVLRVGLEQSDYIHTDDTGARHQGKNGYTTVIGNDWFTYFQSSDSKRRENFLHILQGGHPVYVLNEEARQYLEGYALGQKNWQALTFSDTVLATDETQWQQQLDALGITTPRAVKWVTEAALPGGLMSQGLSASLMLLSDGAPQFRLFTHALCWVHAERILRKLPGSTAEFRANIETAQTQLWEYYQALKAYQRHPTETEKAHLWQRFDVIFGHIYPHHASLNLALASFMQHKEQLLRVLDFPDLPLHNNAAETDIREFVTRRKISGGTRSDVGRQARDTFIGIKKTCRKLGLSFWRYLCSRFRQDTKVAPLPEILLQQILEMKVVSIPT